MLSVVENKNFSYQLAKDYLTDFAVNIYKKNVYISYSGESRGLKKTAIICESCDGAKFAVSMTGLGKFETIYLLNYLQKFLISADIVSLEKEFEDKEWRKFVLYEDVQHSRPLLVIDYALIAEPGKTHLVKEEYFDRKFSYVSYKIQASLAAQSDDLKKADFLLIPTANESAEIFSGRLSEKDGYVFIDILGKEKEMDDKRSETCKLNITLGEMTLPWSEVVKMNIGSQIELTELENVVAKVTIGKQEMCSGRVIAENGKLTFIINSIPDLVKKLNEHETSAVNRRFTDKILQ